MRTILWIVNSPLGPIGELIYGKRSNGLWMDALLEDFSIKHECRLIVATTAAVSKTMLAEENNIKYYVLPNTPPICYNEDNEKNINAWKRLIETEKPDLMQIWGTEFTHGLCAMRNCPEIPTIIYMQGYLGSIARYYFAGISYNELKKNITIRDILKHDSIIQQQKKYEKSSIKEIEMLKRAGNIITENKWCETNIRSIVPEVKNYVCPLSINAVFQAHEWRKENVEPHSVICTASGYPLKGLHMVLQAIALLKNEYPDIKLYVPGPKMISENSLQWKLRKQGYTQYIERMVKKLGITNNIFWMGNVSQEELAKTYEKASVFVLSSSIENHSSSLKEAMMVGIPSIAAAVGGIPEYITHAENGMLYRFEEYEMMASYIKELFENRCLADKLSMNGRKSMLKLHNSNAIYDTMMSIYKKVLSGE